MEKGLAEINVSDSDELRIKKINSNFKNLITGATPVGAISTVGGGYNRVISSVGNSLSQNNYFAGSLSNYLITSKYITAESIGADKLTAVYADINLANISEAAITKAMINEALIESATIDIGDILKLKSIYIDAANISAGTITADKIKLNGSNVEITGSTFDWGEWAKKQNSLFFMINKLINGGNEEIVNAILNAGATLQEQKKLADAFNTGLDGSLIIPGTLMASAVKAEDLVAFGATIGGFEIDKKQPDGSVKRGLYGYYGNTGTFEMRPEGYFRAGTATRYIEVNPPANAVNIVCDTTSIKEDMTIADTWKWDFSINDGSMNLMYIGA